MSAVPSPLQGKVAVVTGGAGALGLAAVRALLEDGARVALVDLDALRLDTLSRFLRGDRIVVAADVSDAYAVRAAHERVRGELGPVDILVNAAGASSDGSATATDESAWQRILGARLTGTFLWSRAVLPDMTSRGWGRIVVVGGLGSGTARGGPADAATEGRTRVPHRRARPRGRPPRRDGECHRPGVRALALGRGQPLGGAGPPAPRRDSRRAASASPRSSRTPCASSSRRCRAS